MICTDQLETSPPLLATVHHCIRYVIDMHGHFMIETNDAGWTVEHDSQQHVYASNQDAPASDAEMIANCDLSNNREAPQRSMLVSSEYRRE